MTTKTKGIDDAFPAQTFYDEQLIGCSEGLTKREYFAAMAMAGILGGNSDAYYPSAASDAVKFAEALIEALNKPQDSKREPFPGTLAPDAQ